MEDIEVVVSKNIKRLLKEYNINQTELAKIAGVSISTVGKWVLEKSTPRMGAIQKISDHFQIPKSYILKEEPYELPNLSNEYTYYPIGISAGLPNDVEAITDAETISLPDAMMGKYAGNKDIYITRVNGDSMNKIIPHNSLIAVRPVSTTDELKNSDIVVYCRDGDYAVKRFIRQPDKIVFRPDSYNDSFTDDVVKLEHVEELIIKGKIVMYIVNMD